tara:strand:+ start:3686 stop:4066 length:381 start_codon:yes stop_codon:yes gene_type:complete
MKNRNLTIAAIVALLFGMLTIFSGGRALFGGAEAEAAVGNAVPFVLWFNFLAGFVYVAAALGLILHRHWGLLLSAALLIATLFILVAFGIHVVRGGAYEMRTVGAMVLRSGVWLAIVAVAMRANLR